MAVGLAWSVLAASAAAAVGDLSQKRGKAGCVAERGKNNCAKARALRNPSAVAVSPDGRQAYVAAWGSDSIAIFQRGKAGRLSQQPGGAGCIAEDGKGDCAQGEGLDAVFDLAVSPDGLNVYALAQSRVLTLARDPSTGVLASYPLTSGCVSSSGDDGCVVADGMSGDLSTVAVSPDGTSVYVSQSGAFSSTNDGLAAFARRADGSLAQLPPPHGCVSVSGNAPCAQGRNLDIPQSVAFSPASDQVYVGGIDGVAAFDRQPGGALSQKTGRSGCVAPKGRGGSCGRAYDVGSELAISADGRNLYTADNSLRDTVVGLNRSSDGSLAPIPGKSGCISTETNAKRRCKKGHRGLTFPSGLVVSPEGRSLYVDTTDGLITIRREPQTGALARQRGKRECFHWARNIVGTKRFRRCKTARGLLVVRDLAISPDGANLYTADEEGQVGVFRRKR